MLTEKEFIILNFLRANGNVCIDQGHIVENTGCSHQELEALICKGFLNRGGQLEPAGLRALEPYKVKNAVIMAAGLSSRFAPLCYETPKGLLKVKGQILIERQIEQLLEAGISEIYVVVGYMKERFFYLEGKYGVTLVENNEYTSRNNNGSIYRARKYLDNTYILSSDNYFSKNVFEPYIYRSYYAVQYMRGRSAERGVHTDSDERIIKTFPNGSDCWVLLGQVYWDRAFSKAFIHKLDQIYNRPETKPLLWERVFDKFIETLPPLFARKYENAIFEFDSLDELRRFDDSYANYTASSILRNISGTLECEPGELACFEPVKGGLTNHTFTFSYKGKKYIYRHCSAYTKQIVDRKREAEVQKRVGQIGLDRTCLFLDPESGWKLSRFVESSAANFNDKNQIEQVIRTLHQLHESCAECEQKIDFMEEIKKIHSLIHATNTFSKDDRELFQMICDLHQFVTEDNWPLKLCHNDINGGNFLISAEGCDLIDWEYAGMNDAAYDIAKLVLKSGVKGGAARKIIGKYYGRPCTMEEERHILACGAIEDYYWMVWGIFQMQNGMDLENDIPIWRRNALEYGRTSIVMYDKEST